MLHSKTTTASLLQFFISNIFYVYLIVIILVLRNVSLNLKIHYINCLCICFNSIYTNTKVIQILRFHVWRVTYDIPLDMRKICAKKQQRNIVIL